MITAMKATLIIFGVSSASAFAPGFPVILTGHAALRSKAQAPTMQLYNDGIEQGAGVTAKYIGWPLKAPRPATEAFDGTWVCRKTVCAAGLLFLFLAPVINEVSAGGRCRLRSSRSLRLG